jgi:hypothetical protein
MSADSAGQVRVEAEPLLLLGVELRFRIPVTFVSSIGAEAVDDAGW